MKKSKINWLYTKLPIIFALLIYLFLYLIRLEQGGFDLELDLFHDQRNALEKRINKYFPSPQAQLLSGIVLGEKKNLPIDFHLALRDTSTLHIVVVSGQNLSMVAFFFLALSGLIKRKVAIILSFVAIIFYTLLTGAQIPVLRASIMVTLTFMAQILGRQKESVWILIVTAAVMLLINPKWIADLSFQLSFMATLGLTVITPILLKFLKSFPLIGQDLAVTLGAQIMVIPIIAQNFHQISVVGVLTNIFVGWTIPFIMILGGIFLLVNFISQILGQILAVVTGIILSYFIYIVSFFATLPFAWEYVGEKFWIVWVGYYLILGGIVIGLNKNPK